MLVEGFPTIGPMKRQQANYRVWGHRKACWKLNSCFHVTTCGSFSFFLSSFQDFGVQYLNLLSSPSSRIAIRERANIDDLWLE